MTSKCWAEFWLVCGKYIPDIEIDIALVLCQVPTKQALIFIGWYCLMRSLYHSGRFLDTILYVHLEEYMEPSCQDHHACDLYLAEHTTRGCRQDVDVRGGHG